MEGCRQHRLPKVTDWLRSKRDNQGRYLSMDDNALGCLIPPAKEHVGVREIEKLPSSV